jgi:hypothetical protein
LDAVVGGDAGGFLDTASDFGRLMPVPEKSTQAR